MSSTDFLSCDGTFLHLPDDKKFQPQGKRKGDLPPSIISIASLSSQLSTDHPVHRQTKHKAPQVCCVGVNTVSLIASCITMVVVLAVCGYFIIRVSQSNTPENHLEMGKLLAAAIIPTVLLLIFFLCFLWGLFTERHLPIVPFLIASVLILFASVGSVAVGAITLFSELDELHKNKMEHGNPKSARIQEMLAVRVAAVLVVVCQLFFVYCYFRSFLYIRRLRK